MLLWLGYVLSVPWKKHHYSTKHQQSSIIWLPGEEELVILVINREARNAGWGMLPKEERKEERYSNQKMKKYILAKFLGMLLVQIHEIFWKNKNSIYNLSTIIYNLYSEELLAVLHWNKLINLRILFLLLKS